MGNSKELKKTGMKSNFNMAKVRRTIYRMIANIDRFFGVENKQVIFSLHGVSNEKWYYNNSATFIRKLIQEMTKRGWTPGRLSDIKENTRWGKKNFYLTFDDGYQNVLTIAQYLYEMKIQPTAFLIADSKARDLEQLTTEEPMMNEKDIRLLKKYGWEFGSHSMTHCDFYEIRGREKLNKEIIDSKDKLTKKFNIDIKYFAYPRGRYTTQVTKYVKNAGYKFALTMDDSIITTDSKNHLLPRIGLNSSHTIDEAIDSTSPTVVHMRGLLKEILKKTKHL
jgi:peptidoglycan/xylan/chitin deacetylase (PgdA/CDA1 family)